MSEESVTPVTEETNNGNTEETTNATLQNEDTLLTNSEAPAKEDINGNTDEETTEASDQTLPPDTYADFVMPEGIEVDTALLAEATPIFKDLGLSQEQAQKLVDLQAKQVQASSQSQVDNFNQLMNDWQEQSKNDKEFGGDAFEENISIARTAIDKFGSPGLKQLLEEHGVGNHPEVIRFMFKVGKLTMEDSPTGTNSPVSQSQDRISLLYPNDKNN